jgi:hypothetical protein
VQEGRFEKRSDIQGNGAGIADLHITVQDKIHRCQFIISNHPICQWASFIHHRLCVDHIKLIRSSSYHVIHFLSMDTNQFVIGGLSGNSGCLSGNRGGLSLSCGQHGSLAFQPEAHLSLIILSVHVESKNPLFI